MSRIPDDYVDVAQRIREFKERYPEGSLQAHESPRIWKVGDREYIGYCAAAYRTPDDERPGIGWAWEPVPGPTPFTKDSELMNAETSAWGRAIVALGFETKKIASAEEVRNRQDGNQPATEQKADQGQIQQLSQTLEALEKGYPHPDPNYTWTTEAQRFCTDRFDKNSVTQLSKAEMQQLIEEMERRLHEHAEMEKVPFA